MKITFSYLVTTFFTAHLGAERGLSPNSIASYADAIRLLLNYASQRFAIPPEAIDIQLIGPAVVLDFLDALERERQNGPVTRNQRLAAIKTFFHFLVRHAPELMHHNERIQAIRSKRTDHQPPPSLTAEELAAILAGPDPRSALGARDKALLHLMYNTGARVQELADLSLADLRTGAQPTVTLTGKRRKTRVIPLWTDTVEILAHYLACRKRLGVESEHLFLNIHGKPMTRFGIGARVAHYAALAAARCPSLQMRHVSPHTFRHTTALHLVEAGNDIAVVKDWLGHAHIKTTCLYLEVSVERKRKALEKLPPPAGDLPQESPKWMRPALMAFLIRCARPATLCCKPRPAPDSLGPFQAPTQPIPRPHSHGHNITSLAT